MDNQIHVCKKSNQDTKVYIIGPECKKTMKESKKHVTSQSQFFSLGQGIHVECTVGCKNTVH